MASSPPWRKYTPPSFDEPNVENQTYHETVRASLSSRTLNAMQNIMEKVNDGQMSVDVGYFSIKALVDVVSPFVLPDVALTIAEVLKNWQSLYNEVKPVINTQIADSRQYNQLEGVF